MPHRIETALMLCLASVACEAISSKQNDTGKATGPTPAPPAPAASARADEHVRDARSKEYALMGRDAWTAFACASLAGQAKDVKEFERLFTFGYGQGQKFLDAIEKQQIEQEDFASEVP